MRWVWGAAGAPGFAHTLGHGSSCPGSPTCRVIQLAFFFFGVSFCCIARINDPSWYQGICEGISGSQKEFQVGKDFRWELTFHSLHTAIFSLILTARWIRLEDTKQKPFLYRKLTPG